MCLKKAFSMLLVLVIVVNCFTIIVSAHDLDSHICDEIIDGYQIAANPDSILGISGTTATYTSKTFATGGTQITVEHTLQKHWGLWIWNDVAGSTVSKTVNSNNIYLRSNKSGLESGTYRVISTFTMTNRSGQTETITIYSNEETLT